MVYSIGSITVTAPRERDPWFNISIPDSWSHYTPIHGAATLKEKNCQNSSTEHVKIGMEPRGEKYSKTACDWFVHHAGRTMDIFKIDCEGCELDTFPELVWCEDQHHAKRPNGVRASPKQNRAIFDHFQSDGHVVYHKEPNTLGCNGYWLWIFSAMKGASKNIRCEGQEGCDPIGKTTWECEHWKKPEF